MNKASESISSIPLIVDLDGTLVKSDTLQEAFVRLLSRQPLDALRALFAIRRGRAAFKAAVANFVLPDPKTAPIDETVLYRIKQARTEGRKVYLATASDKRVALAIADSIGEFDGVFASDEVINLKGKVKADRLVAAFGLHGFDYIGNDRADIPVWLAARSALVVRPSNKVARRINREIKDSVILTTREAALFPILWALRPHQWLKNTLVALPSLAAHALDPAALFTILVAFTSFSLSASSVYVINDMLDLENDRAHPEKRYRPLAAGRMPLSQAIVLVCILAALSIGLALLLPPVFILVLAGYFALAMSYAFYLKRKLMIDVVALAALYGIRVVAGGAATGVVLSHWLVGFCFFIFLSLALMKRTTEIILLPETSVDNIKGRNYRRTDLPTINALTAASGFVAVLIFALYMSSPEVRLLYRNPDLLWGVGVILVYWLGRAFFMTGRGQMRQDPVVFAATDRVSLQAAAAIGAIVLAAL
jgi:4-hydroxybenzoate polyprenyltransferase